MPDTSPHAADAPVPTGAAAPGGDAAPGAEPSPTGHVVVCGLDHLGLRTVEELRLRDATVVVVAPDDARDVDPGRLGDVGVVRGDQRHDRVLRDAGVDRAAAIVLTADDDLGNLHAALAAAELNPDIRVVMRLFDAELGAKIPTLFPRGVALSSSALAAPGFVSAALDGETGGSFVLAGRVFSASAPTTDEDRGVDALPIARLRADRSVDLLPDAAPGEPGLIVVTPADADGSDAGTLGAGRRRTGGSRGAGFLRRGLGIRDRFATPDRRLINLSAVIVALAIVSAVYFQLVAAFSPIDALSYALSLLTGAGSGLSNADPASAPVTLKIYAILLSLCGAAVIGVVYALITDAIIGSRLLRTLGRRPIPASIRDHVIVCGLGAVGYRIALGIAERGVKVVAIELNEAGQFVSAARAAAVPILIGDARQPELLDQAGLRTARAVIAATNNDLVNLEAVLNARASRPDVRVVVRVFDPDFALRVQHGFKIRFTRSVSHLAAPAFASAALGSEVVATFPVGDRRVVVFARVRALAGSALVGRTLGAIDQAGERRVLGTVGPGATAARWRPAPDEPLRPDEEVIVAATRAGLARLQEWARAVPDQRVGS